MSCGLKPSTQTSFARRHRIQRTAVSSMCSGASLLPFVPREVLPPWPEAAPPPSADGPDWWQQAATFLHRSPSSFGHRSPKALPRTRFSRSAGVEVAPVSRLKVCRKTTQVGASLGWRMSHVEGRSNASFSRARSSASPGSWPREREVSSRLYDWRIDLVVAHTVPDQ